MQGTHVRAGLNVLRKWAFVMLWNRPSMEVLSPEVRGAEDPRIHIYNICGTIIMLLPILALICILTAIFYIYRHSIYTLRLS